MIDQTLHTITICFGEKLELSFTLTEWEYNRFKELQNSGYSEEQAIGAVKNELRQMGHIKTHRPHPN